MPEGYFPMQNVDCIDYQYFVQVAVQIGYGNAISTECKPLKSNDLAREIHYSNIVIFCHILASSSNKTHTMQKILFVNSSGMSRFRERTLELICSSSYKTCDLYRGRQRKKHSPRYIQQLCVVGLQHPL